MTDSSSYPVTEQEFLEDNIATVAFHLGQPGARLTVSHDGPGLVVDPGEVLKEISRRLSCDAQRPMDRDEIAKRISFAHLGDDREWKGFRSHADRFLAYAPPSTDGGTRG